MGSACMSQPWAFSDPADLRELGEIGSYFGFLTTVLSDKLEW